jgi:hypothetical protein
MPWEDIVTYLEVPSTLSQGNNVVLGLEIVGYAFFHGFFMLSL